MTLGTFSRRAGNLKKLPFWKCCFSKGDNPKREPQAKPNLNKLQNCKPHLAVLMVFQLALCFKSLNTCPKLRWEKFAFSSQSSKKTPKEQFYWILTEVEAMVEVTIPIFGGGSVQRVVLESVFGFFRILFLKF